MGRYSVFISYSHADTPVASWLHHALETYRVPRQLVDTDGLNGPIARRLKPVFRDRDELSASTSLGAELRAALRESDFQIVLCSERAAKSKWVNEEVLEYKAMHGDARTFALIVDGEPYHPEHECFPPAIRFRVGQGGLLTTEPAEPIAADLRAGKDGRRLAFLKLMAAVTGARLDQLVRRDEQRRRRRLASIATGASAVSVLTAGLAVYANYQRIEANHQRTQAEAQRRTAEASLDFLIGTFQIANPATENPRTISAVTLLQRVSDRVKTDLRSQPGVSARLLRATGEIYFNLGLPRESERDLRAAIAMARPRSASRTLALMQLAQLSIKKQDIKESTALLAEAGRSFNPQGEQAPLLAARLAEYQGALGYLKLDNHRAVAALKAAARDYGALPGDHRLDVGRVYLQMGLPLVMLKQYGAADGAYARAQDLFTQLYGPNHVQTADAIKSRAFAAVSAGRAADAERLANSALIIFRRVLDPKNPKIGDINLLLGRIQHSRGDLVTATQSFGQAIVLFTEIYGQTNSKVGDTAFYDARAWSDMGKPDRALQLISLAKRSYDVSYGPVDPDQVQLLQLRAQVLRVAGRANESHSSCVAAESLQRRIDAKGPDMVAASKLCADLATDPPAIPLRFEPLPEERRT